MAKRPNVGINHPVMVANRWKPGQSGNPTGRPPRQTFEFLVTRLLDEMIPRKKITVREEAARMFVKLICSGNERIIREYLAREWPAITQVDVSAKAEVAFTAPDQYVEPAEWEEDRLPAGDDDEKQSIQ